METRLSYGCEVLADRRRYELTEHHICVVRTTVGLEVNRRERDAIGRWQLVSDNPDHPTVPLALRRGECRPDALGGDDLTVSCRLAT